MKSVPYRYKNAPIPGGGYVTGFSFDPSEEGRLYCRTDIGGCYRFSPSEERWYSLIEHVGMEDLSETFPIALAAEGGIVYIICGDGRSDAGRSPEETAAHCGRLCVSKDEGKSFVYEEIPCYVHGNLNGRGTGKRLVVSPSGRLFFASQRNGLGIRETDGSWSFRPVGKERFLTFVWVSADERTLVAGTAGIDGRRDERRGHSLFLSTDGGESFVPLKEPEDPDRETYSGCVAYRYATDGDYLYVSFTCSAPYVYSGWWGYSCDGGNMRNGRVMRYSLTDWTAEDITPEGEALQRCYGFGGIATQDGMLVVSSIGKMDNGDVMWLSRDRGEHWEEVLHDLAVGNIRFRAPYMRPECHEGHSLVHWMTDLEFDPFNADVLWFTTGTGAFRSTNFRSSDRSFADCCDGIEETVHLNLYSPPSGDVLLLDILGDLGGFAFRDLDRPCDNSFADEKNNRYITCINADYPDADPSLIAVSARGNWVGTTKGGVILSRDQAKSWERLPLPFGLNADLDRICAAIETPNVNPGWVAMNADGSVILVTLAEGIRLGIRNAVRYDMKEKSWSSVILPETGEGATVKFMADPVDSSLFYGFGDHSRLYVSRDGGRSFTEENSPLPEGIEFGLIDCADRTEIRRDSGVRGRFYLALEKHGLWVLEYDGAFRAQRLSRPGDTVFCCGLGFLEEPYIGGKKMIYISGILDGRYGFYRSADEGESWELLNDDEHRFGEINSVEGDSRCFGRFFIATGSLGVLVGEEQ
ncbi:MAG: endoglucanase [Lachnospiraceae bacterium]|nr:endoglucanase [Lachnospiraceae bacterium]